MKKLMQRFFGIAVSAAMLFTSGMTAVADGHAHRADDKEITDKTGEYTITLTTPENYPEIDAANFNKFSYGAYQIFSGTVKGESYPTDPTDESHPENPGTEGTAIPITDIKWGNAFGIVGTSSGDNEVDQATYDKAVVGFVIALAQAPSGKYDYAFSDFDGFSSTDPENAFIQTDISGVYLADRFVSGGVKVNVNNIADNHNNVNFDKLAVAVADVLAAHTSHEWLQKFADILGGYEQGAGTVGTYAEKGFISRYYSGDWDVPAYNKYKIENVPAGYYMILDRTDVKYANEAYSARMLFVANNITQVLKEDIPQLDKEIKRSDNNYYETEAAGVGDEVNFRLTGHLPSNYDNYTLGYQFIFTDTLSAGLTLKGTGSATVYPFTYNTAAGFSVSVLGVYDVSGDFQKDKQLKIATTDHDADGIHTHATTTYAYNAEVKKDEDTGIQTLTVTFPCLKEIKITDSGETYTLGEDSVIYIDYTAIVNKNAIVSPTKGNKNTAILTYSDNPQSYGDTDNTTPDNATVYTFGLDIVKIDAADFLKNDGDETKAGLDGAKFILVRPGTGSEYQIAKFAKVDALAPPNPNAPFGGKEYYSIDSWEELGELNAGTTLEKLFEAFIDNGKTRTDYELTTYSIDDEKGHLNISGLNDGVIYTMVETATPTDGDYAKIDPFTINLTANQDGDEYDGTLKGAEVSNEVESGKSFTFENFVQLNNASYGTGSANMLVANFKYTDLPSTGGVGTVWFYILGAGGVGLAGVLFFLSKKKVTK